ncbi:hypothetical protein [Bartonella sp. AU16XJBT]|nr:hypothetical protein [Bartonella sp. AU16XJBT]
MGESIAWGNGGRFGGSQVGDKEALWGKMLGRERRRGRFCPLLYCVCGGQ